MSIFGTIAVIHNTIWISWWDSFDTVSHYTCTCLLRICLWTSLTPSYFTYPYLDLLLKFILYCELFYLSKSGSLNELGFILWAVIPARIRTCSISWSWSPDSGTHWPSQRKDHPPCYHSKTDGRGRGTHRHWPAQSIRLLWSAYNRINPDVPDGEDHHLQPKTLKI